MNSIDWNIINWIVKLRKSSVSELIKVSSKSRSSLYLKLKVLQDLGIVENKKGLITLKRSSLTQNIIELLGEGFPIGYLKRRRTELMLNLLEPMNIKQLSRQMGLGENQIYKYLHHLYPLIVKKNDKYFINPKNKKLIEMLRSLKKQVYFTDEIVIYSTDEGTLKKVSKNAKSEGTATGFSRFREFGVEYYPVNDYLWWPKKSLSLEEIFVHALKASENANSLAIAIIFYLKNQQAMDLLKIESYSRKFRSLDLWYDIQAYLNRESLKKKEWFLPFPEFKEKCRLYNVSLRDKYPQKDIGELFTEIGAKIRKKVKVYLLGGVSLMFYELKHSTKDIDFVVTSKDDFNELKLGLHSLGFRELKSEEVSGATIFNKKGHPTVDIFRRVICGGFNLSTSMIKRASLHQKYGKLEIYSLSLEDVFLFKAASSREGDILDCVRIVEKHDLDWDTILKEYQKQQDHLDSFYGFVVLDHLEMVENRSRMRIPIIKRLLNICLEEAILFVLKKEPKTVKEILSFLDFPEYKIRNTLERLIRKNKVKKIQGKPLRFKQI